MEGDAPQADQLCARHFRAAQAACETNSDTLYAGIHGAFCCPPDGSLEGGAFAELLGNGLGHELSVAFRMGDFVDADIYLATDNILQGGAQAVDFRALATDDDAGPGAVEDDTNFVARPFDVDARHAGKGVVLFDEIAHLLVGHDKIAEILFAGVPARTPFFSNAQSK